MGSAGVVEQLKANNCSHLPSIESQVRPLTKLEDAEEQALAWERAQEIAAARRCRLIPVENLLPMPPRPIGVGPGQRHPERRRQLKCEAREQAAGVSWT